MSMIEPCPKTTNHRLLSFKFEVHVTNLNKILFTIQHTEFTDSDKSSFKQNSKKVLRKVRPNEGPLALPPSPWAIGK